MVQLATQITMDMIEQALRLDRKYYPTQYWLSMEQCRGYFAKNDRIYTMLVDDGRVVGYLNFSPIVERKYNEIASGKCLDTTIMPDDIETYRAGNAYYAYLSSVVIDEQYRGRGYANLFIKSLSDQIVSLYRQNIYIRRIVADVLNDGGEKVATNFGLQKAIRTENNSVIYQAELIPTCRLNSTPYNRELVALYKTR